MTRLVKLLRPTNLARIRFSPGDICEASLFLILLPCSEYFFQLLVFKLQFDYQVKLGFAQGYKSLDF